MIEYRVIKIDMSKIKNLNEYCKAIDKADIHYCKGLDELKEYCGGKLHKQRNGYAGTNGNIEYIAERI